MGPGGALMARDGVFMYRLLNDPGVRPGSSENKAPAATPLRGLFSSALDKQAPNSTLLVIKRPHAGLSAQKQQVESHPGLRS